MSEITIHTGLQGDWNTINIDWFDSNSKRYKTKIEVIVLEQDCPRTLEIRLNEKVVSAISSDDVEEER